MGCGEERNPALRVFMVPHVLQLRPPRADHLPLRDTGLKLTFLPSKYSLYGSSCNLH